MDYCSQCDNPDPIKGYCSVCFACQDCGDTVPECELKEYRGVCDNCAERRWYAGENDPEAWSGGFAENH